jgi:hypothetical protein
MFHIRKLCRIPIPASGRVRLLRDSRRADRPSGESLYDPKLAIESGNLPRNRRNPRLALLNDLHRKDFHSTGRAGIVWSARRDIERFPGLYVLVRFAIDFYDPFALKNIDALHTGMGEAV